MGWATKDNPLVALADVIGIMLENLSPKLSGNMKEHIEVTEVTENSITLCISAKFYDLNEYNKSKNIIYTGKSYNGITDYAMWVNDKGAFGSQNKSMHWVNRICYNGANLIGNTIGAIVVNQLDLS